MTCAICEDQCSLSDTDQRWLYNQIHITINNDGVSWEDFKRDCEAIGVKPLRICDWINYPDMAIRTSFMTASPGVKEANSREGGWSWDTTQKLREQVAALRKCGYNIIRKKIETVPWHPYAQSPSAWYGDNYLEAHFKVKSFTSRKWVIKRKLLVSVNVLTSQLYVTLRRDDLHPNAFNCVVISVQDDLEQHGWNVDGDMPTVEFTIFDSNRDYDAQWEQTIA